MNFLKKLLIPSGEKEEVTAYKTYTVRWWSRYGEYSNDIRAEVEVFTTKEDADKFAKSLKEAYSLLRHTSGTKVYVENNN